MKHSELENAVIMNMVKDSVLISREEEMNLIRKAQAGDNRAMEKLISAHVKFAIKEAGKFEGHGIEKADLVSEACLGMIVAAKKFDVTRNIRFITYAVWWIRDSIQRAIWSGGSLIHLPKSKANDPLLNEKFGRVVSMDKIIGDDSDGVTLGDIMRCEEVCDTEEEAVSNLCSDQVAESMETLPSVERLILKMHFGINDERRPHTLAEIGDATGYSKEGVRQIIARAKQKLRDAIHPTAA